MSISDMTVREFFASGRKGGFAQQLLRTYDDPCEGNFRLLRAVADGGNVTLLEDVMAWADYIQHPSVSSYRAELRAAFPMLSKLDREVDSSDYSRLPREREASDAQAE